MRRRRVAALAITSLLAAAVTAGCASSSSSIARGELVSIRELLGASSAADTYTSVTATGAFGKAPTVTIPAKAGSGALYTKTLIQGTGPTLTTSQSLLGNFVLYDWSGKTHKLIGSTYSDGVPTLFTGSLLPGLETALEGQKVGSRVLAVIPPKDAFGTAGNSQIGVGAKDTVVFVIDMVKSFDNTEGVSGTQTSNGGGALPTVTAGAAGKGPTITIPKTAAPKTLQVKTLIKGTGPVVKKGQLPRGPVHRGELADREGLRLLLVAQRAVGHRDRRGPGHQGLGHRPGRPDRRQPGAARHPAGGRLRQRRVLLGRHQGHRHAGVRDRHHLCLGLTGS